jgi:hypothetical protein
MIYVNGLYRSGTTVSFNICKQLINKRFIVTNVKKCHEKWITYPVCSTDFNIYSYRDLRSITASIMRKRNLTEEEFCEWSYKQFNVNTFKDWFDFLLDYDHLVFDKAIKEDLKVLSLRYEYDILNIDRAIYKIVRYLNLLLPKYILDELSDSNSIQKNILISNKLTIGEQDPITMYHHNHINLEHTNFKNYISEKNYKHNSRLNNWLRLRGYEK